MGTWWEPVAALTCTSLFTASGVPLIPCGILENPEIELQKGRMGLLPGPGTLSSSTPSFLEGLLPLTSTRPATPGVDVLPCSFPALPCR